MYTHAVVGVDQAIKGSRIDSNADKVPKPSEGRAA